VDSPDIGEFNPTVDLQMPCSIPLCPACNQPMQHVETANRIYTHDKWHYVTCGKFYCRMHGVRFRFVAPMVKAEIVK
jgi:hypothetical protein